MFFSYYTYIKFSSEHFYECHYHTKYPDDIIQFGPINSVPTSILSNQLVLSRLAIGHQPRHKRGGPLHTSNNPTIEQWYCRKQKWGARMMRLVNPSASVQQVKRLGGQLTVKATGALLY